MTARTVAASLLLVVTLGGAGEAGAQPRLLDVPFVPQSEALCGGAAAAMVLRYWGAASVYAEDFASVVDDSAGGITVGRLTRAIHDRGWRAMPLAATAADVQSHLAGGRPIIALIEVRPRRYHYVVTLAWTADRVVFHDPASAPFREMDQTTFLRAWDATGRTALLVLPAHTETVTPTEANAGDASSTLLDRADAQFLEKRWKDAAALAQQVVDRDPANGNAWQLLAASRFLDGDPGGALAAWNRRGEPRVDLARVEGLGRTRFAVVSQVMDLPPQSLLTADDLSRAARRVAALPSALVSRVGYSPREDGTATIDVAIVERPLLPTSRAALAAAAVFAATMREARVDVASPSGNGELWAISTRWWSGRPRAAVSLAAPRLGRWTGLWRVEGAWEQQTYSLDTERLVSDRRHAGVTLSDWKSAHTRWELMAGIERWRDRGHYLSFGAGLERRYLADTLAVRGTASVAPALAHGRSFLTAALSSHWRSSPEVFASWTADASIGAVTSNAPLDLWLAGDTGVVRSTLLRAHPLFERGVLNASRLRRALLNGTLEYRRPFATRPFARFAWAAFVDGTAQDIDAGAGLRMKLPSAPGTFRLDVGRGLRDGATALSASWQAVWPS
jgi:hypothetical protein